MVKDGKKVDSLSANDKGEIVLSNTPFYGESGGQVADIGTMFNESVNIDVTDVTKPIGKLFIHKVTVTQGEVKKGDILTASINTEKRNQTARHHTATHLLQKVLRSILGNHVDQAGSLVCPDNLRFDFNHFKALTKEELKKIEKDVNEAIIQNYNVSITEMSIEQARKDGGEIKEGNTEQKIFKIPSLGSVVIGNNVEIGANTAIDRGTIENTIIGDNTKIDDLVMIGHNCRIGQGCMIVSQVGSAGSCVIGDRVVIAGQAGLADHINIGNDSIIAAKAGVSKSFPEKSIVVGIPAVPRKEFIKQLKIMKDAGDLISKFKKYEPLLKSFEDSVNEGEHYGNFKKRTSNNRQWPDEKSGMYSYNKAINFR